MSDFAGFGPDLVAFLEDLRFHNEREWFQEHKARYEASVREPALAFIEAMAPRLAKISPELSAEAKKSGGSLMRIYRDLRFARDAAPYKTNLGIQFRHRAGKDVHAPGLYLHVEPGEVFLGAGAWRPASAPLRQIRQAIVDRPDAWRAAIGEAGYAASWSLGGESLSRAPRGFDPEHPLIEDIKRKDFIALRGLDEGEILGPGFVDEISLRFAAATPLMRFLCQAIGVGY
jgi:uncharacterized protein (TIGR02453 family)